MMTQAAKLKNILHLSETSEPGGSETVLAYIANRLDPQRYKSLVCLLGEGWLTARLKQDGVEYEIIENKRPYDPVFLARLVRLIKRRKIDLIHAHEFMMNVYGSVAARLTGVPMIGTVHGKLYFTEKRSRIRAYRLAVALCSRMVPVSDDLRKFFSENLKLRNADKIQLIYNGIDLEKYCDKRKSEKLRNQLSIAPDCTVAGTVGSLFEVKGIPYLLEAARKITVKYSRFRLLIAGEGSEESRLRQMSREMGLQDKVTFLGFRSDIPEILSFLDIYVCSSLSEGLSLSILEAMAASRPVVATEVGGNSELIMPGENGILVPPGDSAALANGIMALLNNADLREKMGRKGREIVEQRFSLDKMIENYQNLYERLMY